MNIYNIYKDIIKIYPYKVSKKEFIRCINKATIIIYENNIHLIMDNNYIYYFGALPSFRTKSLLGTFVKKYKYLAKGKMFYSYDIKNFKRKTKLIDNKKRLYKWD